MHNQPSSTYTCARCGGVYESAWTDEEAEAEKTTLWGDVPLDQCDIVCDDCFTAIMPVDGVGATCQPEAPPLTFVNAITGEPFDLREWFDGIVREHMAIVNQRRGLINPRSRMGRAQRRRYCTTR